MFSYSYGFSQIINFPDANFKARLLLSDGVNGFACIGSAVAGCLPGPIDVNQNGEIEVAEAQNVAILYLQYANISDLIGIEYFINLEYLYCNNNTLTSIDLSQLTNLKRLGVQSNQLTAIDISNQAAMEIFFCIGNQITSLDFSNNTALQRVYCNNNLLTSLDFSTNLQFFDLGCRNNPNLTSIKIKNGMQQVFGPDMYQPNTCWDGCPNLTNICADSAEIPDLQSYLASCGINTSGININSACVLGNEAFGNQSIKVFPNPVEGVLTIDLTSSSAEFRKVIVYNVLGETVFEHQLFPLSINEIDVSTLPTGMYMAALQNEYQKSFVKIIKN